MSLYIGKSGWGKGILNQRKAPMSRSKIKVLLVVFFNWKGIVHHEFVPRGHMVNKQLYQEVLARLSDAVRRKSTIILNKITFTHRWF